MSYTPPNILLQSGKNYSSTQWGKTIIDPSSSPANTVPFPNEAYANGFTFFTSANIDSDGTTSWNPYAINYGIEIEIIETTYVSGDQATITISGVSSILTYDGVSMDSSVATWLATNKATINLTALVYQLDLNANAQSPTNPFGAKNTRIRFCTTQLTADAITITALTGTSVNGDISNPFTGLTVSAPDHVLVPYVGEPYEGQRLHHNMRVNFGLDSTNIQTVALSLRRFADDSIIGSEIPIIANPDVPSQQNTFITYTAGVNDPFVQGGFYFALLNTSGSSLTIQDKVGILLQNYYETPNIYP